jgi:CubicO group peptidase (beta-lactamase class C family)
MVTESSLTRLDLDAHIRAQPAHWTVPGVVVGLLLEDERETRAWGAASLETGYPLRPDTLFHIGSIAKVYTAALIMTLVDEGSSTLSRMRRMPDDARGLSLTEFCSCLQSITSFVRRP